MDVVAGDPTSAKLISPYSGSAFDGALSKNALRRDLSPNNNHNPSSAAAAATAAAMTVLADGNIIKHQRSRQRKVHSCVPCHKKKIKCSRDHPVCSNCLRSDLDCRYFVNERVSRGGRSKKPRRVLGLGLGLDRAPQNEPDTSLVAGTADSAPLRRRALSHDAHRENDSGKRTSVSTTNSGFLAQPESSRDSIGRLTSYSGSLLSPETVPKLPGLTENGFSSLAEAAGHNAQIDAPEQGIPFALGTDLSGNGPIRHVPSTDLVSNITNKFFNTNYQPNTSNSTVPEDTYSLALGPMCYTPIQEMDFPGGLKSPHMSLTFPNKNRADSNEMPARRKHSNVDPLTQVSTTSFTHSSSMGSTGQIHEPDAQRPSSPYASFVDGQTSSNLLTPNVSNSITMLKDQLDQLGSAQENSLNPYSSNPAMTINYLYGTNVNYHKGDIFLSLMNHLPKRERSFELVQRYLYSVHDLLPILVNMAEFVREHERFWARMDSSRSSSVSPQDDNASFDYLQFYTLYFPVMYASTISEFEEYDNLLLNQDIDKYLKAFNKICQHYNYPHGLKSTSLLLGNVLIQSTSPNPSTMEMSQIIRYAKFLHLHKDPVKTLRIQDWKVVGFRRKIWWVIFGLDALSSHNFCLPPVCRFSDFNVEIPDHYDPVFSENGSLVGKKLNVSTLAMGVKFRFDRILSDLVYHLHNGLSSNISSQEIDIIRDQISSLFVFIHQAVLEINKHFKINPPKSVAEMNMFNFVKHHSWSFADRALMLLHKKILLTDRHNDSPENHTLQAASWPLRSGPLSLSQYEDTFGRIQEANIIKNFQDLSIGLLSFSQNELFSYNDLLTNLIPSILHNLNDFLKYNDFIKFGKFNWYVKRTIPLDSIILLLAIMSVKLKYEYMGSTELIVFVKLVNKTLFILNRKYYKNEKYKRMLSLTNATWEYILKKYNVVKRVSPVNNKSSGCAIEFLDHQVAGFMNMSELFTIMDVPQPAMVVNGHTLMPPHGEDDASFNRESSFQIERNDFDYNSSTSMSSGPSVEEISNELDNIPGKEENDNRKTELIHLNNKIYYDLRNNFVDINDYCTFYSSLENVLHSLMDYINEK